MLNSIFHLTCFVDLQHQLYFIYNFLNYILTYQVTLEKLMMSTEKLS